MSIKSNVQSTCVHSSADRDPQRGAALLEYALVVALVGVVGISGVRGLGGRINDSLIASQQAFVQAGAGGLCQPGEPCNDPFGQ